MVTQDFAEQKKNAAKVSMIHGQKYSLDENQAPRARYINYKKTEDAEIEILPE